jgi:plasmid stabilization system protein ParE
MKVAWTARARTRLAEIHDYIAPYRIIYRVSATGIEILTVKHYRQRLIDRPDDF